MATHFENLYIPANLMGYMLKYSDYNSPNIFNLHNHPELELNLVINGAAYYIIEGKRYDLIPGTLIWLFRDQCHGLIPNTDDFDMWIAYFSPNFVKRSCSHNSSILNSPNPGKVLTGTLPAGVFRNIHPLFSEIYHESKNADLYNSGLGYLLNRAWKAYGETNTNPAAEPLHPAVTRMIQLMNPAYSNGSLSKIAGKAGLSYSRLSRVFKKQTGQSIIDFRDRLRVERFLEIYRKDRFRTVLDCAIDAGFGSYAQFYRVFKKQMGINPGTYCKNN